MSDLTQFSKSFMEDFIELYINYPCLWKTKSSECKDRNKKDTAYTALIKKLQEIGGRCSSLLLFFLLKQSTPLLTENLGLHYSSVHFQTTCMACMCESLWVKTFVIHVCHTSMTNRKLEVVSSYRKFFTDSKSLLTKDGAKNDKEATIEIEYRVTSKLNEFVTNQIVTEVSDLII
ncbi:hypothetical protein RI129_008603 [Pyrocoelia pectoralis]|uniref:MADF domain-containing protein n=1 Tax=Pyrocoelia pectoralis TaxID=417401 RepID=A0AAN7VC99_9COLE